VPVGKWLTFGCPLLALSGHWFSAAKMSAFGLKADPRAIIGLGLIAAVRDLDKPTTSPLLPPSIAAAICLPTASVAAFTGSSAR
jgi:hypothetical protein